MLSNTILESLLTKQELQEFHRTSKMEIHGSVDRETLIIGLCLLFGVSMKQNIIEGMGFIKKAADQKNIDALVILGLIYEDGLADIPRRLWVAEFSFRMACTYNDPVAILHLVVLKKKYPHKINPSEDDLKVFNQHMARMLSYDEPITKKNCTYSFGELLKKASKNTPYDLFNLALAHEYGVGTPVDKDAAIELYLKAKAAGHEYGQQYATKLIEERDGQALPVSLAPAGSLPPQIEQDPSEQKPHKRKSSDEAPKAEASPAPPEKKPRHGVDLSKESPQPTPRVIVKVRIPAKAAAAPTETAAAAPATAAAASSPVVPEPPTHITITHTEFKPGIHPELINYSDSMRFFRTTTPKKPSEQKRPMQPRVEQKITHEDVERTEYSDQARSAIGRWGEDFVYNLLCHHYQEKHPNCRLTQQENGFKLTRSDGFSIEVIWHNKKEESFESKDFTVMKHKPDSVEKHYVIEVKTTTSVGQNIAFLSKHEWQQMLECSRTGQKYRIFRVHNAGQANPTVDKIKDPWQKIKDGEIEVSEMRFKI